MTLIRFILLLLLLSVFSIGGALYFKSSNQSNTKVVFPNSEHIASPDIALRTFWQASFNGDEKLLNSISAIPPEDWLSDCVGRPLSEKNQLDNDRLIVAPEAKSESEAALRNDEYSKNSEVSFSGENISDNIRIHANYINASKIKWRRFRVTDKQYYNDEALLRIEIANFSEDFSRSEKFAFAFRKINSEWKIIGIIQIGVFKFVDDHIRYGSPRPACNN